MTAEGNAHRPLAGEGQAGETSDATRLELLAQVPPPRRTDAAFARSVRDEVQRHRRTWWALGPASAATLAAGVVVLIRAAPLDSERLSASDPAASTTASASRPSSMSDAAPLRATDPAGESGSALDSAESDFAIPAVDGSSDEELARLERALDQALNARRSADASSDANR